MLNGLRMRTAKSHASLCKCTGLHETLMIANEKSTQIECASVLHTIFASSMRKVSLYKGLAHIFAVKFVF